jgi:hypothetical protein
MFIMTGIPSSSADREAMENEQEPKKSKRSNGNLDTSIY